MELGIKKIWDKFGTKSSKIMRSGEIDGKTYQINLEQSLLKYFVLLQVITEVSFPAWQTYYQIQLFTMPIHMHLSREEPTRDKMGYCDDFSQREPPLTTCPRRRLIR